ncbi:MAG: hypothetical protein M5U34_22605 [Chloroflexi bacterium]|nr:hypothetical protein [Chloroflexota bacterium]
MDKAITTLLDSYNSNTLWEMARAAQLPHTTGKKLSKGELLALMQQEFFKPKRLKEVYQHLTRTERDVLNRLLLHEGKISSRQFKRQLLRAGVVTEAPSPPEAENQGMAMPATRHLRPFCAPHRQPLLPKIYHF